ncbi:MULTISPECIES: hypothetical protein [unclassified Moorena]|uniref:hypothetical protein n=1 Tax=unclassified Moorena TaxID=2683338 RepID=UPI0025CECD2A|nr:MULTISPECIES: hypothetical protein [unclassified Moorena]
MVERDGRSPAFSDRVAIRVAWPIGQGQGYVVEGYVVEGYVVEGYVVEGYVVEGYVVERDHVAIRVAWPIGQGQGYLVMWLFAQGDSVSVRLKGEKQAYKSNVFSILPAFSVPYLPCLYLRCLAYSVSHSNEIHNSFLLLPFVCKPLASCLFHIDK